MLANVIVIAVVAALLALSIRSLARSRGGECSSCGSASSCATRQTGQGSCVAAKDMLARAGKALANAATPPGE